MAGAVAARRRNQAKSSLEVTIRLLPENAVGPEEITRRIELPPAAATRAAARGAEPDEAPADDNRGRDDEAAPEARERGREAGQEAEEQRENRENAGRPDDRGPPDDRGHADDRGLPMTGAAR